MAEEFTTDWDYRNSDHGKFLLDNGAPMVKKPSTVYLHEMSEDFSVLTNEGHVEGSAGDFVAYDPQSGHIWPVSADYIAMHYEPDTTKAAPVEAPPPAPAPTEPAPAAVSQDQGQPVEPAPATEANPAAQ